MYLAVTVAIFVCGHAVATPFPSNLFQQPSGEKDFEACLRSVDFIPPLSQLPTVYPALPHNTRELLSWLLLPTTRKRTLFTKTTLDDCFRHLQSIQPDVPIPPLTGLLQPTTVLRNVSPDVQSGQPFTMPIVAFHGTHTENLHSILNTGLLNLSGTKLQRTGDAFGKGIYLR